MFNFNNSQRLMQRNLYVIIIFCLALSPILAQPVTDVPVHMKLEVADERFEQGDFYNALELYEESYTEVRDLRLAERIAGLHYRLRDFKRAERWYERIVEKDKDNKFPDAVLMLARVMKINGKYQEAIEGFNFYANLTDNDSLLAIADLEVAGIQLASQSEAPIELVVENIGRRVNSSYTEFAPHMTADGALYFSSIKSKEVIRLNGKEGDYYAKIYKTELDKKGKWAPPKSLSTRINREGYHTGNASFSEDGQRMYFTRTLLEFSDITESKIFVSESNKNNWGAANEVNNVNGDYIAKHPVVGSLFGREVLFFSSDMQGGFGGFDLYYSTRNGDNDYSLPVNLGPAINTAQDEITPFFQNNRLYFSSNGQVSIGGLDIYYSDWDGQNWAGVENMGMGYNSSFDDLYFSMNSEGNRGFIVSNRPADGTRSVKSKTCCDEVFEFEVRDIIIDLMTTVFEGKDPLPGAKVTIFEIENNQPGKSSNKSNEESNDFQFLLDMDKAYKVLIEKEGYYPKELEFNTVGIADNFTVKKTVALEKIPSSKPDVEIVTINEPIRLNRIYYDLDDDKILPEAEEDLRFIQGLMSQYPDMVIELSSHTDAQGQDAYNERLSQRRAQSAKNWLVARGVKSERIQAVGYGESQIINHCVNGMDCTDEDHRVNRRTEFKIIAGPTSIEIKKQVPRGDSGSAEKKKDLNLLRTAKSSLG